MAEAGLAGFDTGLWFGLLAPTGTPPAALERISTAARQALASETVVKALAPQGIDVVGGTPEEFAAYIANEMKRWDMVTRAAGLKK
jgi:tripartite-type tricarboxylate transporter receptor subunit TctC